MDDYSDEFDDEDSSREIGSSHSVDSDVVDSDFESSKAKTDTSAVEAREGKDIQGIPWERLHFTRDKYRQIGLKQYKNYKNLPQSRLVLAKDCLSVKKGKKYYDFQFNTMLVGSTISHFQNYSVMHWSSLLRRGKEILNVAKPIVPKMTGPSLLDLQLSRVQMSTMAVKENLLVAGGFQGELICKYLNRPGVSFCTKLTTGENAITNAVDICHSPSGSLKVMTANNGAKVRIFDADSFTCLSQFPFNWPINNTASSPDDKLFTVLGDRVECLIADTQSGKHGTGTVES